MYKLKNKKIIAQMVWHHHGPHTELPWQRPGSAQPLTGRSEILAELSGSFGYFLA